MTVTLKYDDHRNEARTVNLNQVDSKIVESIRDITEQYTTLIEGLTEQRELKCSNGIILNYTIADFEEENKLHMAFIKELAHCVEQIDTSRIEELVTDLRNQDTKEIEATTEHE
jgi:hypothetical protein